MSFRDAPLVMSLHKKTIKEENREIGLEMFDLIWNVCDLANKLEIDLDEAFQEKMEINRDRLW